jgi:hypothetical protein
MLIGAVSAVVLTTVTAFSKILSRENQKAILKVIINSLLKRLLVCGLIV